MQRNILGLFIAMLALIFISCDFFKDNDPDDQTITFLTIPGVTAPVQGEAPVTTAIDTEQYTGSIIWAPDNNPFEELTTYTAIIILSAKEGWTLTGVAANSFTVAGATAVNVADSGTVVAEFPATFAAPIFTMVDVPAGSFQRDATATNISIISTDFRMSEKEITMEQFVAVTGMANPSNSFTDVVNGPVQYTNWYHALVFCNKLSMADGKTPVYTISSSTDPDDWDSVPTDTNGTWDAAVCNWSADGYRLPTEMEWMWAAMGGSSDRSNGYTGTGTNTTGYTKGYAGSTETAGTQDSLGYYAWYTTNSSSTTHTVGEKTANELGLYDMSGNVWEWCWDWFAAYPLGEQTDYHGAASSTARVYRGASWAYSATGCTVANKSGYYPYFQGNGIGFRVVCP